MYRVQAANSEIKKEFKNLLDRIKMSKAENSKISVEIIKILTPNKLEKVKKGLGLL